VCFAHERRQLFAVIRHACHLSEDFIFFRYLGEIVRHAIFSSTFDRPFCTQLVSIDNEHAARLLGGPSAKAFPVAKLVRVDFVVIVGLGDRDHDRTDWKISVGGLSAVQATTIRFLQALHVLFEGLLSLLWI
jgi:hypothetical protein